jgi:ribosomal protein S18 acetylase RimI-like enzyme
MTHQTKTRSLNYGKKFLDTKQRTTIRTLTISKKLAVKDGLFFVAVENSQIVGTIMAGYDGHRGWLYSVAVDPNKRLSGLGSLLVHHAEAELEKLGCLKVKLQILASNQSTAAFYESLGYAIEPNISMGKLL